MMVARSLEVVHHVDGNVEVIKALAENIDDTLRRRLLPLTVSLLATKSDGAHREPAPRETPNMALSSRSFS